MKIIDINNKVFKSEEYLKDKYLFDVFEKKIIDENAKIMSDEENYVITNESEERAPWIRTKDNIDKSTLKEIEEVIKIYLVKDKMTFTCKKELYDNLLEDDFELIDRADYFELGFMLCEKLKETKSNDGWLDKAKPEERELIEKYVYNFETFIDDSVTNFSSKSIDEIKKECAEKTEEEMNNPNFYVLRNKDNKIVCMARYRINKNGTATTGLVYTPDEERGKGYAAKLVYELTKMILERGCIPVLYTDKNYANSNKAYSNVGYENKGMLISFTCRKKGILHEHIKSTENDIIIRKATIQDIDGIIKLNKILFDLEYNNFDDTLDINRPTSDEGKDYFHNSIMNNVTLVATIDDNIVGYMIGNLNTQYSYNTVKQAELNNMCILDEYRKLGIGTEFITEFKKICKDNNIQEIKVIASYENINAINFYKKNGFNESELTLKIKI